uniref:Uncharacterized protein n=1 Tax=Aegilops tauschii subsp. strangulata TaxID=200361 RepID=A0A453N5T5_AEGTS
MEHLLRLFPNIYNNFSNCSTGCYFGWFAIWILHSYYMWTEDH